MAGSSVGLELAGGLGSVWEVGSAGLGDGGDQGREDKVKGQGELWTRNGAEKQLPMTGNK